MTERVLPKPLARVRPRALICARPVEYALAPRGEVVLFHSAEVLSEGRIDHNAFFGSTLISIDWSSLGREYIGDSAAMLRDRLMRVVSGSVRVRLFAIRLAASDVAQRHPDLTFGTALTETRFRANEEKILIDVDLEVPLVLSSSLGMEASQG